MALETGDTLGPYQIVSKLGSGGMGEVYRARDTRLNRDVAIKVVRTDTLRNVELRRRLAHEANASAGLNHPNIVAVFDVHLEGETPYIVSELVEGESLGALIQRGPLSSRKLVDIAVQIADGMAAAHQAAIVHRDLKPANILLTRTGRVKIVDFGLAKSLADEPSVVGEGGATVSISRLGVVQGSVEYMSPEQARGEPLDTRSDTFSFGLIMHEMATGKRPFTRRSVVETLGAIINAETPPLPDDLPTPLKWCIERCLAKDPPDRYNSTLDLFNELRALKDRNAGVTGAMSGPILVKPGNRDQKYRRVLLWLFGAVAAAALSLAIALWMVPDWPDPTAFRYTPLATSAEGETWPAWSPQGGTIAYSATVDGRAQIFTRSLESPTAVQVTHRDADCERPQWSSDGRQLFFRQSSSVWVVGAAGGDPKLVMPDVEVYALSRDTKELAFIRRNPGAAGIRVWISSPPGAEPKPYEPAPFEGVDTGNGMRLQFTPDGKGLLMWGRFYGRGSEFWMLPYPAGSGTPKQIMETLRDAYPVRGYDWLPDGKRLVLAATLPPALFKTHLYLVDPDTGKLQLLVGGIGAESVPSVSRDGKQIAYTSMDHDNDIVELSLNGGPVRRLIASRRLEHSPVWSPRGRELAYVTDRSGADEIWIRNMETGREQPVVTPRSFPNGEIEFLTSPVFSPDGDRIALVRHNRKNLARPDATEIWIAPAAGGVPVPLTNLKGAQWAPTWSADGNWIAFTSQGPPAGVMRVRVGSTEAPEMLRPLDVSIFAAVAEWSPKGDWIAMPSKEGVLLMEPESKKTRILRKPHFYAMTWTRDGSAIVGQDESGAYPRIVSVDVASGRERELVAIPEGLRLRPIWVPGQKISLSPDGKSLATTAVYSSGDVWLLEDFEPKSRWTRLFGR